VILADAEIDEDEIEIALTGVAGIGLHHPSEAGQSVLEQPHVAVLVSRA
jgi:hypothetical protein